MADWPTGLPFPLLNGNQGSFGETTQRTAFDSGPDRQRQKFVNAPDEVQVGWKFYPAQMVTFRDFYQTTINGGAAWFNMELNIGYGFQVYEVRFIGKPDYQYLNPLWQVSGKIDVRTP